MAARDSYHDTVRTALEKDGWIITDDPLTLKIGRRAVMVDLGAEKLLAAQRGEEKIAVEIKSFLSPSPIKDLENALGQFILYARILDRQESERRLYLAINRTVFNDIFSEEVGQLLLETTDLRLVIFDEYQEEIVEWLQ